MHELEALFEKRDFNSFPVVEEGKMLGIVTKFDFLRASAVTAGQMVPHYDEFRNDDRSRRACRTDSTIDTSSPVDGGPQEPQLSSYRAGSPIGRNNLSRGRNTRTQRGDTGRPGSPHRGNGFVNRPRIS